MLTKNKFAKTKKSFRLLSKCFRLASQRRASLQKVKRFSADPSKYLIPAMFGEKKNRELPHKCLSVVGASAAQIS